ncbi:hypothetical protein Q8A73_023509 [Channa argus]|nr:hypothetical protein Q8A73_023509 [Channa argus]
MKGYWKVKSNSDDFDKVYRDKDRWLRGKKNINMIGFLLLLLCLESIHASGEISTHQGPGHKSDDNETSTSPPHSEGTSVMITDSSMNVKVSSTVQETLSSVSTNPTNPNKSTISSTSSSILGDLLKNKECLLLLMVCGGLIIACTILLLSTLLLIWKVCQLNRRLKALSSNNDLISTTEYCVRAAKMNENQSEPEPKESTILMSDFSQTQEDMGNGSAKEEGGKVNEDGQIGEENKKEAEGTGSNEEASTGDSKGETRVTVAENSSSSQPQENTTNSQFTNAEEAPSSEGTEESKDVV